MKKRILSVGMIAVLLTSLLAGCSGGKNNNNLTKITLNEVAHSIFYAPCM